MHTLGQRIRNKRQEYNMPIQELADLIGVTRQTVTNWEADKSEPTGANLTQLCEIFGIDIEYFMGSESELRTKPKEVAKEAAAATDTRSVAEEVVSIQRQRTYLIFGVISAILFAVMIVVIACVGTMVFSDARSGGDYVTTVPIGVTEFVVACAFAAVFAAGTSIFFVLYASLKNRRGEKKI